jgi:Tfp pilus assembly protein PilV
MRSRARKNASGEDGFIIIEVLVSALILAIVAGAVLTLIAATTRGAAAQRNRSVAYDLAQADQARLRTLRITEINGVKAESKTVKSNGTVYTVLSERVFDNNKAGAVSCVKGKETPDYVQLTTTVSAVPMQKPVVLQSVVSPSTGSLNPNYGGVAFSVANALGEPLSGVAITLNSGQTAATGTEGCATFSSLPKTTYSATYSGNTLIDEEGKTTFTETGIAVLGGETNPRPTMLWDHPSTLAPEFVYVEPGTGTLRPAPVDSMTVANATSTFSPWLVGTPAVTTRTAIQTKEGVFPYKSPSEYTVYAGSCATNNPGSSNPIGLYSAVVPPGALLKPQIHVPALELTVTKASGVPAEGAQVTVTDANSSCKYNGSSIKRVFTANAAGHLSNKAKGETEAGLPFGTYNICASLKVGTGSYERAESKAVKVENFTTTGTTLALKLVTGSKEECP